MAIQSSGRRTVMEVIGGYGEGGRPVGQIRILVVDDQALIRDALRSILGTEQGFEVVGTARDGNEALEAAARLHPDVVLMDIRMPEMNGVEATRLIKAACPATQVVILTTYEQDDYVFDALGAGAAGYLLKDMPAEDLIQAIRGTVDGGTFINPSVASRLVAELTRLQQDRSRASSASPPSSSDPSPDALSTRELEVLTLVARGLTNREIARQLFLTEGTVKNYISGIYSKLQTRDRVQAALYAREHGLADLPAGKAGSPSEASERQVR